MELMLIHSTEHKPRNGGKPGPYNVKPYRKMRSAVETGWIKNFREL
jgi:hypothetical protein